MPKKLDPRLIEILTKHGEDVEAAIWDCHGTWVVYHKAIERIAAKADIAFDMPVIIEANTAAKTVAIAVKGKMGDNENYREEWSFGEASPANNKNAYPYAMAEKRAKDRVVLKLVGLHGLAYSEEESDDFKPQQSSVPNTVTGPALVKTTSSAELKRQDIWPQLERELAECGTVHDVTMLATAWSVIAEKGKWSAAWKAAAREAMEKRRDELAVAPDDDVFPGDKPSNGNSYVNSMRAG